MLGPTPPGSIDPGQRAFGDPVAFATCALLYNYPDRPFPEGSRMVPEVAAGEPLVSEDGRTYRVRIRPGFRFSPPSNEPVTAAAFERALERVLSPANGSYGRYVVLDIIVGADDYWEGRTKTLEGVDSRGGDLVIRLTKPVPDLPARLASPYFCAVPPDTPLEEAVDPVPSAGPYYIAPDASYAPERSLVLRRNPNYGGERPQGLEEIRFEYAVPGERAVEDVEAGRADGAVLQPGLGVLPVSTRVADRLEARYGPDSEAAQAGHQQLFTGPVPAVNAFVFNTQSGPFANPRLRRAVNYAIDRPALAEDAGFGEPGKPTDQYIPRAYPGFEDAAVYPLGGPDLAKARRLAGDERHHAMLYTCSRPGCTQNAQILQSNLDAIGIDLDVRQFPVDVYFSPAGIEDPDRPWDIAHFGRLRRSVQLHQLPLRARRGRGAQQLLGSRPLAADGGSIPAERRGAAPRLRQARPRPRRARGARRGVLQWDGYPLPLGAHGLPSAASALRTRPRGALRQGRRRGVRQPAAQPLGRSNARRGGAAGRSLVAHSGRMPSRTTPR